MSLRDSMHDLEMRAALQIAGVESDAARAFCDAVGSYAGQVSKWNPSAKLMAKAEVEHLTAHAIDAISLLPYWEADTSLLDIGSGGGIPGMVLAMRYPERTATFVERSAKKAAFLKHTAAILGLQHAQTIEGEFPRAIQVDGSRSITARAVERPEIIARGLFPWIDAGSTLLCQSARMLESLSRTFHVEHIQDAFTERGWRRGDLWRVTKNP